MISDDLKALLYTWMTLLPALNNKRVSLPEHHLLDMYMLSVCARAHNEETHKAINKMKRDMVYVMIL